MSNDINQDVAKELVAQTAGKTYDDLAHPTAHATGQIVSFIPRTVKVWLGKWEKWILNGEYAIKETEKLLEEKLKHISEDKIVEPEPYVAVPAIQQLSYSFDSEELRDMYANLLAASMNVDTKWDVHPSFVEIIKQLTPDEAKLLKKMPKNSMTYAPLIDLRVNLGNGRGHVSTIRNFTNIADDICESPQNISSYIYNLNRLGIINVLEDIHVVETEKYQPLEHHPFIEGLRRGIPQLSTIHRKSYHLTEFGQAFIKTCVE